MKTTYASIVTRKRKKEKGKKKKNKITAARRASIQVLVGIVCITEKWSNSVTRAAREWNRVGSNCLRRAVIPEGTKLCLNRKRPKRYFILFVSQLSMAATFIREQGNRELCKAREQKPVVGVWNLRRKLQASGEERGRLLSVSLWWENVERKRDKRLTSNFQVTLLGQTNRSPVHFLLHHTDFEGTLVCLLLTSIDIEWSGVSWMIWRKSWVFLFGKKKNRQRMDRERMLLISRKIEFLFLSCYFLFGVCANSYF